MLACVLFLQSEFWQLRCFCCTKQFISKVLLLNGQEFWRLKRAVKCHHLIKSNDKRLDWKITSLQPPDSYSKHVGGSRKGTLTTMEKPKPRARQPETEERSQVLNNKMATLSPVSAHVACLSLLVRRHQVQTSWEAKPEGRSSSRCLWANPGGSRARRAESGRTSYEC